MQDQKKKESPKKKPPKEDKDQGLKKRETQKKPQMRANGVSPSPPNNDDLVSPLQLSSFLGNKTKRITSKK